jgi:DNA-binding transcriptional ArsR family regulator
LSTSTGTSTESAVDLRIVKALGHPLRQRILLILNDRVASPSEIAAELGEPLANVAYHVGVLRDAECIELVRTAAVRGALQHFYRPTVRAFFDDSHWARLPPSARRALFGQTLDQIWSAVTAAAESGGFDRVECHVTWTRLQLDEDGWKAVADVLNGVLDSVLEIQAQSLDRLVKLPEEQRATIRSELAMMHFERGDEKRRAGRGKGARRGAAAPRPAPR